MTVRIGYIPYLNMVPFHQGFGPAPVEIDGKRFEFVPMSPHVLGLAAESGSVDAGAISLVDGLRLSATYEPIGAFGIGLKRAAESVLVFSRKPLAELSGICAVTDETSTSYHLLQILLGVRYGRTGVNYGRIASAMLFDGEADALLLIGDEALKAKAEGITGLAVVTDLGEEWYAWQGLPFVFARWSVRRGLDNNIKNIISQVIQKSLKSVRNGTEAELKYWDNFVYELTPQHERSIALFSSLLEKVCSAV